MPSVSRTVLAVGALAIGSAIPVGLSAQEASDTAAVLPELTVTAERRPAAVTSAAVRVIDGRRFVDRAAPDLMTVLRDVPGIQVDPVVGSGAGISMQGLGADRILILIDGAPVPGRISNEFDITRLAPRQFSRIEIVEGPQSTLYGSSALGGVVNLITRRPGAGGLEVRMQGGSAGQFDAGVRASRFLGGTATTLDIGRRHVDIVPGRSATTTGAAERWDGLAQVVHPVGNGSLSLRAIVVREDQEYLTGSGASLSRSNNLNTQADVLAALTRGRTEFRLHGSVYDHNLRGTSMATGAVTDEPQVQRLADAEVIHRVESRALPAVLGVRAEVEQITSDRIEGGERSNRSIAGYFSAERPLADELALSLGGRLTVAESWGTHLTPRLGVTVGDARGWYAKAGVAGGFRAPSFLEQFADYVNTTRGNYAIRGNPDLQPETSWNLTAETGVRAGGVHAYLRGYGNRLREFIETEQIAVEGGIPVFSYRNVGQARTAGAEIGMTATRGIATVTASYARLDARNEADDTPLLGQAEHTVRAGVMLSRRAWSLEGEFVRASEVPLSRSRSTGELVYQDAWPRWNVRGSLEIGQAWRLSAGVDNLGDVVPDGAIGGFGRRVHAGLTWRTGR